MEVVQLLTRCTCSFMMIITLKFVACLRIFSHLVIIPLLMGMITSNRLVKCLQVDSQLLFWLFRRYYLALEN